ncbi:MAG: hypothetical protein HY868_15240 [Chloroflexi bacterium]|nr:hypothetical protein [Chloroflexota bacterium]
MKQRNSLWLALAMGVFVAHAVFYFVVLGYDAVDDAFISFRYAQNAVRGIGLVFNPGERVEGFTNFLWTVAMIPLEGIHADVGRASMVLGALFALATMWLVVQFAKTVDAPRGVGLLAAGLLAADGSFVLWSVSGLETPLFGFLIFAGAWLYVRENNLDRASQSKNENPRTSAFIRVQNFPLSGIFFALAGMTRPEGLLVFAITVAHQAAWRILAERRLFTGRDVARVATFAMIFVPYWLGRWWYFKSLLPNSFHAKVSASGPAAQIERGWRHLSQFVGVHLSWIILLPALAALINSLHKTAGRKFWSSRLFWLTYFIALIAPYCAYIVYVGGDWSVGRFFAPLMPLFYLVLSTGVVEIWRWIVDKWGQLRSSWVAGLGITALILLIILASSWMGEYGIYIKSFDAGKATLARETMGRWLKANVPPGTLIAVDAAGQVPYFSDLPAVDMFGINDLHIGRLAVPTLGTGTPGHEKFDLGYVLVRQPQYVVIFGTLFDSIAEYERVPVTWTDDPALAKFLTLYRRKSQ